MYMFQTLTLSPFFRGLSTNELEGIFKRISHSVKSYSKGQIIAQRDDEVRNLCIVVEGAVKGEMVDFSGKVLKVEEIQAPNPIAHAVLFGDKNRFPVDVIALTDCRMLYISKPDVVRLLQTNEVILNNFLNAISNRAHFLAGKLWFLSFKSIKEKVAHYLLSLDRGQPQPVLVLPKSHQELAELFGVTRPALARVLGDMQAEGIIIVNRREVEIVDRKRLVGLIN